jgi:hypothetical protein
MRMHRIYLANPCASTPRAATAIDTEIIDRDRVPVSAYFMVRVPWRMWLGGAAPEYFS